MEQFFDFLKIVIISITEGITEFLPVSSTGHMIIVSEALGIKVEGFMALFVVVIQLGAIMAVVVLYKDRLLASVKDIKPGHKGLKFWTLIAIAVIPAGIIGLLFDDIIEEKLMNGLTVSLALIVGAIIMIITENKYRKNAKITEIESMSYKTAAIVGAFQTIAILWPGFSRSAATIIGGWIMGLSTVVAAEFSFFLAIPTMFFGSLYKMLKYPTAISSIEVFYLLVGLVISYLVAKVVIEKFISYLQNKPMRVFAVYRILVGTILLFMFIF